MSEFAVNCGASVVLGSSASTVDLVECVQANMTHSRHRQFGSAADAAADESGQAGCCRPTSRGSRGDGRPADGKFQGRFGSSRGSRNEGAVVQGTTPRGHRQQRRRP